MDQYCAQKTNDPINRACSEGLNLMDDSLINAALDGENEPRRGLENGR